MLGCHALQELPGIHAESQNVRDWYSEFAVCVCPGLGFWPPSEQEHGQAASHCGTRGKEESVCCKTDTKNEDCFVTLINILEHTQLVGYFCFTARVHKDGKTKYFLEVKEAWSRVEKAQNHSIVLDGKHL